MLVKQLSNVVSCALLLCTCLLGQATVKADTITFEADALGIKPNGFQSVESNLVRFSASDGGFIAPGTLVVDPELGSMEFIGTRGLAVSGSPNVRLNMDFLVPVNSTSLFFGNDDFFSTVEGDRAILRVYDNDVLIGQTSVVLNRNDLMDQAITFSGPAFNRASFHYTAEFFLTETVDNVTFTPVPEPATILLLATGVVGVTTKIGRRRKGSCKTS